MTGPNQDPTLELAIREAAVTRPVSEYAKQLTTIELARTLIPFTEPESTNGRLARTLVAQTDDLIALRKTAHGTPVAAAIDAIIQRHQRQEPTLAETMRRVEESRR